MKGYKSHCVISIIEFESGIVLDNHKPVNCVAGVVSETEPVAEEEISEEDAHVVTQLIVFGHKVQERLLLAQYVD